jgi:type VI secretion system secreted protein VgrG
MAIEAETEAPGRWFHGLVTEFRLVKVEDRVAFYAAVLRPWLWTLSLTHDCRIF